jgi:hypothetical protein
MNARIRELAEQAQQYAEYVTPQGLEWFNTFKEKFAELIVRECLPFVEPTPGSGDIDDLALEAAREGIKEHFGVEE